MRVGLATRLQPLKISQNQRKKALILETQYQTFYVISSSAEISQRIPLITGTLDLQKIN